MLLYRDTKPRQLGRSSSETSMYEWSFSSLDGDVTPDIGRTGFWIFSKLSSDCLCDEGELLNLFRRIRIFIAKGSGVLLTGVPRFLFPGKV